LHRHPPPAAQTQPVSFGALRRFSRSGAPLRISFTGVFPQGYSASFSKVGISISWAVFFLFFLIHRFPSTEGGHFPELGLGSPLSISPPPLPPLFLLVLCIFKSLCSRTYGSFRGLERRLMFTFFGLLLFPPSPLHRFVRRVSPLLQRRSGATARTAAMGCFFISSSLFPLTGPVFFSGAGHIQLFFILFF